MRILYFSNHIGDTDFNLLVKNVQRKPNPAGQNFHGKLIRSLALNHEVVCFSIVPSIEEGFKRKTGIKGDGIPHYYFYPPKRKIIPTALTMPRKIVKTLLDKYPSLDPKETVVVYDTLNVTLARTAKIVAKKLGARKIAICTDDPYNISEVGENYITSVLHYSSDADGFFCLTKGLDELFNKRNLPSVIHLGVVEKDEVEAKTLEKPYLYYGGALFYKDGTDALLEAYMEAKPNCLLVLSGHGPSKAKAIEFSKSNPNIIFLGQISKQENYAYQKGAAVCINPRLYRGYLDKVSVPSKVLEYLTYGEIVASTLSTPIKEAYGESVNWIPCEPSVAKDQLVEFFHAHMDEEGNLVGFKANDAKDKILEEYGLKATADKFDSLLEKVIS